MNAIEALRDDIRNLIAVSSDPFLYGQRREKLMRNLRRYRKETVNALNGCLLTPEEVLFVAEANTDEAALSGDGEITQALFAWIEREKGKENTDEIRLYAEEAARILSSLI